MTGPGKILAALKPAILATVLLSMTGMLASCGPSTPPASAQVPKPLDLLLPQSIRIHPFTGLRTLDGSRRGLEVRIEAIDSYQDATKAFGSFRFDLYKFKPYSAERKGELVDSWELNLMNPRQNVIHWDSITRAYIFKLQLNHAVPAGQRLVLTASYSSPFTNRLFADLEITAQ